MRYAKINESIWNDSKFKSVSDSARLLYMYLLSCPKCNSIGVFQIGYGLIEDEFDHSRDQIKQLMGELEEANLLRFRDGWLWFNKYLKWNEPTSPNHARHCASDLNECVMREAPQEAVRSVLGSVRSVLGNIYLQNTKDGKKRSYYDEFKSVLDTVIVAEFVGGNDALRQILENGKSGISNNILSASNNIGSASDNIGTNTITRQYKYNTKQDNTKLSCTCDKETASDISLFCSDGLPTAVSQAAVRLAREGFPSGSEDSWAIALHHVYKKNLTDPSTRPDKTAVDDFFTASMASELRTGGMA